MKTNALLSLLLIMVTSLAFAQSDFNLDSSKIVFFIDNSILISKLIDGNFPDYKKVIPSDNSNILNNFIIFLIF